MPDDSNKNEEIKTVDTNNQNVDSGNISAQKKFGTVTLKDRFEINFDENIEWLDSNGAKAYAVYDRINKHEALFALMCSNTTYARNSVISVYKKISNVNMIRLVDRGVTIDPLTNEENVILIYEKPLGGRVIEKHEDLHKFKDNNEEIRSLFNRFISIFETLKKHNFTHRSIRIDNLYYKNEEKTEIILGDCLATFPAYYQPAIYETVEMLLASREGRGDGTLKNDIYSAGILALLLFSGLHDKKYDDEDTLDIKLNEESYFSVTGNKIQNTIATKIIRHMVEDDEDKRWSTANLYDALNDTHSAKTLAKSIETSKKSIIINDKKIYSTKELAIVMSKNIKEAYEIIKNGRVTDWLKNGLQNEELHDKIDKTIKANIHKTYDWETLTSKIMIMLCPNLPIIFKGVSIFPDALGKALYVSKFDKDSIGFFNTYSEMLSQELVRTWYQEKSDVRAPINPQDFKTYIESTQYGYGIFRIVYEIDIDTPCTSKLLNGRYIFTATRILQAIDSYHDGKRNDELPYDKQLIAYIYSKLGNNIDRIVNKINSNKEYERVAHIIKLYSMMQLKYGPAKLPNLSKWLAYLSSVIIKSYHNLKYRKFIEKEIVRVLPQGNLGLIYNLIDDESARKKDVADYNLAMSEVSKLTHKKNHLTNSGKNIVVESTKLGQNTISIVAIFVMILSFLFNIINWVSN